jgi:hypothetical protein
MEVFAPFVSRINVATDKSHIIISWKNSEDLFGYKQIFRYTSEINESTIQNAQMIARVAPEVESYIDTPQAAQSFFYAVLIEDKSGDLYKVFIPFRNKSIESVRLEQPKGETDIAAEITSLSTEVIGDSIVVHFSSSNKSRELILYRSTSPLASYPDLLKATYSIVVSAGVDRVKDIPVAGVDYYYTVLDAGLVSTGKINLIAGKNTMADPVKIPLREIVARSEGVQARTFPLPAPDILYGIESGEELLPPAPFLLPQEVKLNTTVQKRVDFLLARMKSPQKEMSLEVLAIDEALNLEGEQQLLQSIIGTYLRPANYKDSIEKLNDYLSTHHIKNVESRARFYLGQAYYFHGEYKEALIAFNFAQEDYYQEVQKWLDVCLEKLEAGDRR